MLFASQDRGALTFLSADVHSITVFIREKISVPDRHELGFTMNAMRITFERVLTTYHARFFQISNLGMSRCRGWLCTIPNWLFEEVACNTWNRYNPRYSDLDTVGEDLNCDFAKNKYNYIEYICLSVDVR